MIELNDIWQAPLVILACKLCWDTYSLLKGILIDYIAEYIKDKDGI